MRTVFAAILSLLIAAACTEPPPVTSTLIVNAIVFDGTGSQGRAGAVRIDGDRIVAAGDLAPLDGETVVDAGGLALAPGFIDTHSHHDRGLAEFRHMPGVLSQGITTIVRGVDGSSGDDDMAYAPVADFDAAFEASPAAVNVASYSPHNTIRHQVLREDYRRPATREETVAMAAFVAADMQAGALGLATGLEYEPGIYSETDEIIALAKVAAEHGGGYSSHLRDEDDRFIEAIEEIIRIGREAALPVHVSHIKLADRVFWGTTDEVLALLDAARDEGIMISADIYPYERWSSDLGVLFPDRDFGSVQTAQYTFARTAAPEDILVARYPANPTFEGLTIAEIARVTERDPVPTLLDLAKQADDYQREHNVSGSSIIARSMTDRDIVAFMQWPHTNICSDGSHDGGHPRGYGAFPRVLRRYVRETGALALPQALHKMTALAARNAGIGSRGRIAAGLFADLVLFDPNTITDHATLDNSTLVSSGVRTVWVNGVIAFDDGAPTGAFPGRIIRRGE